jgi:tetratricopeptide (TPR) repeat protein
LKFRLRLILVSSALLLALSSTAFAADAAAAGPDFYALAWTYAHRFGIPGIIVFVAVLVWWQWDTISKRPGVGPLTRKIGSVLSRADPLPTADPNRFSVMVARFQDDQNNGYAKLLVNALTGLEGIQVLALEKPITADSGRPGDAIQFGHKSARELLKQTQAQMLIWGRVLTVNDESGVQIFWTTPAESRRSHDLHQLDGLKLPLQFWNEFVGVIQLQVVAESTEFLARQGEFLAERLRPFIHKTERLLADPALRGWNEAVQTQVRFSLANGYQLYGEQAGDNRSLKRAISHYLEALKTWNREAAPLQWATTQNNLGNALRALGERESGTTRLEQAVEAYREALKERTREAAPLQWATTQNNLGNSLRILGLRRHAAEYACKALLSHCEAWEVFAPASHRFASTTASCARDDLDALESNFPAEYEKCLHQHLATLKQMNILTPDEVPA